MCLGISCTNELNKQEAMQHLTSWLRYNPDFSSLPILQQPLEDIESVKQAFEMAHKLKPVDH